MGPLTGIKIVEVAGIGPGPFACMMLADMGAEILRVDRIPKHPATGPSMDLLNRGRPSVGVNLKAPEGKTLLLDLIEQADGLIEGYRPGVMERLGLGPETCLERNPRLVYGRMTGWGQDGPMAMAAGHDINYIAINGSLHAIGRAGERPMPPLNLVGDFGGGGMLMAYGMVCGLLETQRSGKGQVVDAAMVDGSSLLLTMFHGFRHMGFYNQVRGTNMLDTGAHFYEVYECADGEHVSIGSIEPQFYGELLRLTGLDGEELPRQMSRSDWPALKQRLSAVFKQKTRAQWCEIMQGSDVCFAPVLSMSEAIEHPHNVARQAYIEVDGLSQPAPAPRFSRTPGGVEKGPSQAGQDTDDALSQWGVQGEQLAKLRAAGVIG